MRGLIQGLVTLIVAGVLAGAASAQQPRGGVSDASFKTTFVRLSNSANALIVEPATPDPERSGLAILVVHPDHLNTFNYFLAPEFAKRGYRVMLMNYYGDEEVFDEFLAPIAAAVKYLRTIPGVQKVVFAGHSTGGAELTFYQDVAENGAKACQEAVRLYKCKTADAEGLGPADGIMILDSNAGAIERVLALDPSVEENRSRAHKGELNLFDPGNGFDPERKSGTYSAGFVRNYLQAQSARQTRLIADASGRLAKIEKDQGVYKDDEPFIINGSSNHTNDGARLDLADLTKLSKTRTPHPLLKADGSAPTQIIFSTRPGLADAAAMDKLGGATQNITVRHFLSFLGLSTKPDYNVTADRVTGVEWRSTPNSIPGNVQGVKAPTLFVSATCAPHLVFTEIAYELSAAKDKEFIGVDGADHSFRPCKPEYGDTAKHAFDYADRWLLKPNRF
jgi:hypothetical protein